MASSLSLLAEVLLLRLSCLSSQGREGEKEEEKEGSPSQPLKRSRDSLSLLRRGNERRRIDAPLSPLLTANF